MKVIDTFCGAGGFSEGFKQAGFEIILGIDNWDTACESFKLNHDCDIWNKDIKEVETLPKCDILIGSPPLSRMECWKAGEAKVRYIPNR